MEDNNNALTRFLATLIDDISVPVQALIIAMLGIFLAWLWFNSHFLWMIVISLILILLGKVMEELGRSRLHTNPVTGLFLMEFWLITPAMVAAISSGLIIITSVELIAPEEASSETAELLTSLSAAVTAFLTSGFISWSGDEKDSKVSGRFKKNFISKFKRYGDDKPQKEGIKYFKADSVGERLVYSEEFKGIEGWGSSARRKRAKGIAEELKTGNSDPDPTNI